MNLYLTKTLTSTFDVQTVLHTPSRGFSRPAVAHLYKDAWTINSCL